MTDTRSLDSFPSVLSRDEFDEEDRSSARGADEAGGASDLETAPQDPNVPDKQAPWGDKHDDVVRFLGGSDEATGPDLEKALPDLPESEKSYAAQSLMDEYYERSPIDNHNRNPAGSDAGSIHFNGGESSHQSSETGNLSSPSRRSLSSSSKYSESEIPSGGTPMQAQLLARIRRDSATGSDYSFGSKSSDEGIRRPQSSSTGSNHSRGTNSQAASSTDKPLSGNNKALPTEKDLPLLPLDKELPRFGVAARLIRAFRKGTEPAASGEGKKE